MIRVPHSLRTVCNRVKRGASAERVDIWISTHETMKGNIIGSFLPSTYAPIVFGIILSYPALRFDLRCADRQNQEGFSGENSPPMTAINTN